MKHLKPYNENKTENNFWKIPFTFDKPNLEIKNLFDYQGNPIKLKDDEFKIIDNILKPHKNYKPGYHLDRELIEYPPVNWKYTNCRSGYCWFLLPFKKDWPFISRDNRLEVMINKFDCDYYLVHITDDWNVIRYRDNHEPHLLGMNDWYIVDTIDELKRLLNEKVISLYK